MPVVINKESGLAEDLSPELSQHVLQSGTHEFPLNDPEGNPSSAAYHDVPELLSKGYSIPTSTELSDALRLSTHATAGQPAKALGEAGAASATFGLSALAEKAAGVNPKEMLARREALEALHPVAKMGADVAGLVGSSLVGVGEGAALAKVGRMIPALGEGFGAKIATHAVRAGLENAVFQGGDEATKMFMTDPNQSAETAVANIGMAGLLGAGLGGALGTVPASWDALMDGKASKFIADARARTLQRLTDPDPVSTLTSELSDLHSNITNMNKEVYGKTGLKAQDIQKLMPEMTPRIAEEPVKIQSSIQESIDKMADQPFKYGGGRYPGLLNEALNEFKTSTQDLKDAGQLFGAMNELKQNINKYIPKHITPDNPSYDAVQEFRNIGKSLKESLEDTSVWGKAGERQTQINKAFSSFIGPLKDFEKKFGTVLNGEVTIDPGKVNTYLGQLGKPNAEIKQEALGNFLNAAEKYRNEIDKTHANLDIENPHEISSTQVAHGTLSKQTLGTKFADMIIDKGIGNLAGSAIGTAMGATVGHPGLGALFGQHALGPAANKILPAMLKTALATADSGAGFKAALQYGTNVVKGESKLTTAAKSVLTGSKIEAVKMSHDERTKLKDKVSELSFNTEAMLQNGRRVSHYLPEHETALSTVTVRAVQYLATLRPDTSTKAPLDPKPVANSFQESTYNQALDIAQDPTIVLKSVQDGSLTFMEMQHLQNLYPGLLQNMKSKLGGELAEHIAKDGMLPYKVKSSLSLFLGQPLESSLMQPAIAANQMSQHAPAQQPQPQQRPKHSMAKLDKLPNSSVTIQQAREAKRTQV